MPSSSYSNNNKNNQEEEESGNSLMIHADALPCLKRQQLENLCTRLGLKNTGKKDELIQRLQGFAMGKSASLISNLDLGGNVQEEEEDNRHHQTEKHEEGHNEEEEDVGDLSMLPNSASIRVISKPRESHFIANKVNVAQPDPFQMEIGVVLPRSESSNGSLSSLTSFDKNLNTLGTNNSSNIFLDKKASAKPKIAQLPFNKQSSGGMQRSTSSSSSIYPWNKLLGKKKSSIDSLSKYAKANTNVEQLSTNIAATELGLGLHASESQASISSTVKKWLKGEGTSSITSSFPSNRRITRSISAASSVMSIAKKEGKEEEKESTEEQQSSAMASKRKRSIDDDVVAKVSSEEENASMPTSPEVPQRRIKPRPSRAAKKSSIKPSETLTAQEKVWAEMNARLAQAKANGSEDRKVSQSSSPTESPLLPPSPLKSINSRTKGRFSSQHDKEFDRMDSIASHYAARRDNTRKASSDSIQSGSRSKRVKVSISENDGNEDDGKNKSITPQPKIQSVTYAPTPTNNVLPQRTEEERAAIKRKLELARHRRRSSTAAARASSSAVTARRAVAASSSVSSGPSSKLASSIKTFGFAVRGLMGAATRGLTNNSTLTSTSSATVVTKGGSSKDKPDSIMRPPQIPSVQQKPIEKKSLIQTHSTASPIKTAVATPAPSSNISINKKRSTFDLQASLARKPQGYTPYSGRETVEMFTGNSPLKPSTITNNNQDSSISRSSSINFPSSSPAVKKIIAKMNESSISSSLSGEEENVENLSSPQPPTPQRSSLTSPTIKKTRSSASHAARSSIRTGRKSNQQTNLGPASTRRSTASTNSTTNTKRRTTPSLQSINQSMAKDMLSARRSRTNAMIMTSEMDKQQQKRSNDAIQAIKRTSLRTTPKPLPVAVVVGGGGHGSPSTKSSIHSQFVEGKGRGRSNFVHSSINDED